MKRFFRSLLWGLLVSLTGLTAVANPADTLFAVRVLREGGCGGILPGAPPLHHNPILDRTAEEWAAGRTLTAAVDFSGYRAVSAAGLHVQGPDGAMNMIHTLERSACHTLVSGGLHEIGLYRRGYDTWIVLATGHELTAGVPEPAPAPMPERPSPASPKPSTWSQALVTQPRPGESARQTSEPETVAPVGGRPATGSTTTPGLAPAPGSGRAVAGANAVASANAMAGAGVMAAPASAPAPAPTSAPTRTSKSALSPILATRALQLVNNVRARGTHCGQELFGPAPPVALSGTLEGVAFGHASDMADNNYFEHEDLQGKSPSDRVRATGYQEKLVGENIAYGPKSVDEVVQGWLDSPGHCENIMDPRFAEMGVGYAMSRDSKHALYWVQVLASPRNLTSRQATN